MCDVECGIWDMGCGVQLAYYKSNVRDMHELCGVCACVCVCVKCVICVRVRVSDARCVTCNR